MSWRPSTLTAFAAFAALALLSCTTPSPDAEDEDEDTPATPLAVEDAATVLADQICAQVFACDCEQTDGYASEAACAENTRNAIQSRIDGSLGEGDGWDEQCAGELAKTITDWGCLGPTLAALEASFDARICPIFEGTGGFGTECNTTTFGDTCGPELMCAAGVCIEDLNLPLEAGQVCEIEWENLPCESGTYCAYNSQSSQSVCQVYPVLGDSCDPNIDYLCGPASNDLICDQVSSSCIAAPGEGEPCFNEFLCAPGNYCDGGQDFTCQPRRELGEGCGANAVCPVDAICLANICVASQPQVCSALNWF